MQKPTISKGNFSFESSNGEKSSIDFVIPFELSAKIMCQIITWKNDYSASFNEVEIYQKAESDFLKTVPKIEP